MRAKFISNERREILIKDANGSWNSDLDRGHHPDIVKAFWRKFLSAKEDTLTDEDWNFAQDLANKWSTCACGSLDDGISRLDCTYRPVDNSLFILGIYFTEVVSAGALKEAQKTFKQINDRAVVVLREARK